MKPSPTLRVVIDKSESENDEERIKLVAEILYSHVSNPSLKDGGRLPEKGCQNPEKQDKS